MTGSTSQDPGPVSTANGVVYACPTDTQGHMYALNAATGQVLWSFASGGACEGGAAIGGGEVEVPAQVGVASPALACVVARSRSLVSAAALCYPGVCRRGGGASPRRPCPRKKEGASCHACGYRRFYP